VLVPKESVRKNFSRFGLTRRGLCSSAVARGHPSHAHSVNVHVYICEDMTFLEDSALCRAYPVAEWTGDRPSGHTAVDAGGSAHIHGIRLYSKTMSPMSTLSPSLFLSVGLALSSKELPRSSGGDQFTACDLTAGVGT
jgi:hypothetical protein